MTNLKTIKEKFFQECCNDGYLPHVMVLSDPEEVWSFFERSYKDLLKAERERIIGSSYEAMSGNDWTDKNHIKLCGFVNKHL